MPDPSTDPNAPPPPPGFDTVVSAGGDAAPPPPPGFDTVVSPGTKPPSHWYDTAVSELGDLGSGFKTALNQTGETAMRAVAAPIPQQFIPQGWQRSQQQTHDIAHAPLDTGGKVAGAAIENILEFVAGDEALKGLTTAAKVTKLASVERAMQNSPVLARMLGNAVRAQAVGTTQAAAHGATGGEAVTQGAINAVGGAAVEGVMQGGGKLLKLLRPTTQDVLGETVPVLASQTAGASPTAESVADIRSEPTFAKAQQEGGQRGIVNRAQRTAATELNKLNAARAARWVEGERGINLAPEAGTPTAPADRQLPSGQPQLPAATPTTAPQLEGGAAPTGMANTGEVGPYEGDFPEQPDQGATPQPGATAAQPATTPQPRVKYLEEQPPNFNPIDVQKAIQNVNTFQDAANVIRKHAAPIFDRFDSLTDGEYTRLRGLRDQAYAAEDYKGVNQAEQGIDGLFDNIRGKMDRTDYRAAKSAWRSSKILDAVHDAVDRSVNLSDASLATDSDVPRGINGGILMRGINRLTRSYGRTAVEDIIGKDGLTGLTRLSALTQSPQREALYGQKVGEVMHPLTGGNRVGFIPSTIDWSRRAAFTPCRQSARCKRDGVRL